MSVAAAASSAMVRARWAKAQSATLPATPRQVTGLSYPVDWSGDTDADLVRVTGEEAQAQGIVTHLRGRVLDLRGQPVVEIAVEIWQCANGRYRHPST
ncbi:hypothetical protein [Siccirubricoccus sp. G192]|uniref:dioxygenase family protein n=1 Tax=Siccirubricoccus sp. G192 TaxID=2849651 RepID=UPI001C2BA6D7|nr:hypothetical protein [Siccirubricoccus sp. G192]MBV1798711.1 hypothetical protein [Siccirubricoccus sp. G192]